jgi:hypothetical protein
MHDEILKLRNSLKDVREEKALIERHEKIKVKVAESKKTTDDTARFLPPNAYGKCRKCENWIGNLR